MMPLLPIAIPSTVSPLHDNAPQSMLRKYCSGIHPLSEFGRDICNIAICGVDVADGKVFFLSSFYSLTVKPG